VRGGWASSTKIEGKFGGRTPTFWGGGGRFINGFMPHTVSIFKVVKSRRGAHPEKDPFQLEANVKAVKMGLDWGEWLVKKKESRGGDATWMGKGIDEIPSELLVAGGKGVHIKSLTGCVGRL